MPEHAFSEIDGIDSRTAVIRKMSRLDVEACPGSGKTTLLVAKLAILGRKWEERRRGICVLSHTNVARKEIERRLGNTAVGQSLLHYPHFIGTIHGFVNEFLALPWLRSKGYPVESISDEECLERRWKMLSHRTRFALEQSRHTKNVVRYRNPEFGLGEIRWAGGPLREHTPTYIELREVCEESAKKGYFCHDEMFVWAIDLLDKIPIAREGLRRRFPLLFVDEVQDNDERQTSLLYRVFIEGDRPVTRQRFGDSNQAIYQQDTIWSGEGKDAFPDSLNMADLPSSFRFDQSIADLAASLAVRPQKLHGLGARRCSRQHAILLFEESSIGSVLKCYARYLMEIFSDSELRTGVFNAVGAVHRPGPDDHLPRSVGDYWREYDHEIGSAEPRPGSLVQYLRAGLRLGRESGEAGWAVEMFAEGILHCVRVASGGLALKRRRRLHRYLVETLGDHAQELEAYRQLVRELCVDRVALTESVWSGRCAEAIRGIVVAVSGEDMDMAATEEFIGWTDAGGTMGLRRGASDNFFRYPSKQPRVAIRVGSIHSVKGETHTATLVLETFYRAHHLKALKAWLTGRKTGGLKENGTTQARLRVHFVAMSRPSELLCLAMRAEDMLQPDVESALGAGWRVGQVGDRGMTWL